MRIGSFEKHYEKYEKGCEKHRCAYLSELEAVKRLIPEGEGIEVGVDILVNNAGIMPLAPLAKGRVDDCAASDMQSRRTGLG
jgi:NADP-dependent 3-hydroxy acid dehydrogenase YdfG